MQTHLHGFFIPAGLQVTPADLVSDPGHWNRLLQALGQVPPRFGRRVQVSEAQMHLAQGGQRPTDLSHVLGALRQAYQARRAAYRPIVPSHGHVDQGEIVIGSYLITTRVLEAVRQREQLVGDLESGGQFPRLERRLEVLQRGLRETVQLLERHLAACQLSVTDSRRRQALPVAFVVVEVARMEEILVNTAIVAFRAKKWHLCLLHA